MPLITDAQVQLAFDYLNERSERAASARAARLHCEYKTKAKRAELIRQAPDGPMDLKKAWAESHPEYLVTVEKEVDAVYNDERHREGKAKAMAILDAWRTEQATARSLVGKTI